LRVPVDGVGSMGFVAFVATLHRVLLGVSLVDLARQARKGQKA